MIRIIVLGILFFLLYWIIKGVFSRPKARIEEKKRSYIGSEEVMVKDPECGVYVTKGDAIASEFNGETLFFCSSECLDRYRMRESNRS